jgi:ubiquinone/menaquinone biosynthesis C-methylase UbiE
MNIDDTGRDLDYLPPMGKDRLLPLYDPITRLLGGDSARRALVSYADVEHATRVLDIGCGTGTLAVFIARIFSHVEVTGLDPDPKALRRARRTARRAGVSIRLDQGFSESLPYPDASFDRVFSSLMLHHLASTADRLQALREMRRVLAPQGSLHVMDFAPDATHGNRVVRWIHAQHHMEDNSEERVVRLMREAGFAHARVVARRSSLMGRIAFYEAAVEGRAGV